MCAAGTPGPATTLPVFLTQAPDLSPAADGPAGPVPVPDAAFAPALQPALSPDQAPAFGPVNSPDLAPAAFAPAAFVPAPEGLFPAAVPAFPPAQTPLPVAELFPPIEAPFSGV